MLKLVTCQLRYDAVRAAFTAVAIGAVIAVILTLEGMAEGIYAQLRKAVYDRGGDLIATQPGVSSMTAARSILPQIARREVEDVRGVRIAHPMTRLPVIYDQDGRKTPIFLIVYDTAGGVRDLIAGHPIRQSREIIVDESLAKRYALAPGDGFVISDFRFSVAGVSRGTAAIFTPFAFITYDGLLDFYFEADLAGDIATFPLLSFLLIELEPGVDAVAAAAEIEARALNVDVFLPHTLALNDERIGRTLFGPVLQLLIGIAYGVGVLVVGLFMFAAINTRRREYGVLKALGFRNRALFGAVLLESALVTALAVPLGVLMSLGLAAVIETSAPLYLVLPMETAPLLRTIGACLGFAALGALLPIRSIARIEPAMVFHS